MLALGSFNVPTMRMSWMDPGPQSYRQVAQALYSAMPHALSAETLQEYGIAALPDQARAITREVLSVSLFWIHTALDALQSPPTRDRTFLELQGVIRSRWAIDLNMDSDDLAPYVDEFETRQAAYMQLTREGASPVSVFSETAAVLESNGVIRPEDQSKVLALLIDVVPVEAFGDILEDLEVTAD